MLENRSILDRRGNFWLTSRPAARIERILKINPLTTVTEEVVETARVSPRHRHLVKRRPALTTLAAGDHGAPESGNTPLFQ
jgi:hypothetical protein